MQSFFGRFGCKACCNEEEDSYAVAVKQVYTGSSVMPKGQDTDGQLRFAPEEDFQQDNPPESLFVRRDFDDHQVLPPLELQPTQTVEPADVNDCDRHEPLQVQEVSPTDHDQGQDVLGDVSLFDLSQDQVVDHLSPEARQAARSAVNEIDAQNAEIERMMEETNRILSSAGFKPK